MIKTGPAVELIQTSATTPLPKCILLPGWGSTAAAWRPLASMLSQYCDCVLVDLPSLNGHVSESSLLDNVIEQLAPLVDCRSVLMGWSLGGMLATRIASAHPVLGLVTLATNASFVQREGWANAMSDQVFHNFYGQVERAPLKALKRFVALQTQGDQQAREQRLLLQACLPAIDSDCENTTIQLLAGLKLLQAIDNRECLKANNAVQALHLFGEHDTLVPVATADAVAALGHRQECHTLAGAGHYLPGSPALLMPHLLGYFGRL